MVIVRKRKKSRCCGLAMVETALVLPILLMLTFGTIKYGWLFLKAQQITNAARYGARMATLPDTNFDDVKTSVIDLLNVVNGIVVNTDEVTITPIVLPVLNNRPGVNVYIEIPTDRVDILDITWIPEPELISASVTMAKEG